MGKGLRYFPWRGNPILCFVTLCVREGSERGQCCCLVSGGLPRTHPISNYFTHFLYATGVLLAVALVVIPSLGGFAYVLGPCGPFKWTLLRNQQFLLPPQPPLVLQSEVMMLYFLVLELWAMQSGLELGLLAPKVSLQIFMHHM